jgi:tRNA-2-methylthio-N6-dimethylallyladenosine synthase
MTTSNPKYIVFTWGCQMNEDDSEQIAGLLTQMGYSPTSNPEEADVAMLVTCSVREKPEQKAKSKLGELALLKRNNPNLIIGVCGCMAQRMGESIRKGRPYIDIVIGTASIPRLPDLICKVEETRHAQHALDMPTDASAERPVPERVERIGAALKSFVPVMYGCDNYCAYCVVPYVRGRERSRSLEDVVAEVRDLASKGRKEITLLGQNVNSYGSTLDPQIDFADLLRAVSAVGGIERIRFMTSHPKDLSDRMIHAMRDLPNVCEHLHLPVQSGDDDILKRMNRGYTSQHYRDRVAALRESVPNIAITTDFLVGFPGETDEQFENTMRLCEEIRFDAAFMFSYNAIPNTAAEKMPDQVPGKVRIERLRRLIAVQNAITCEINNSQVGRVYDVLVEGASPKDPGRVTGLTRQNKTVNFRGDASLVGRTVPVRATEGHLYGYVGEQVTDA